MGGFSIGLFVSFAIFASIHAKPPNLNDILFNGDYNFIDLTYPFDNNTVYWKKSKHFELTKVSGTFQKDGTWYAANEFAAAEHGGTHINAPFHFHVGEIPLEKLIVSRLSAEIAEWIVSSYKNVVGVGVDTSSVDPGSVNDFVAHKILSEAGVYNLENVKLDTRVPEYGCTALVMPMNIAFGTGAPLRLIALCPKEK